MSETSPLPPAGPDDPRDPAGGTSTGILERTEVREQVQPGDHERFAHYVRKEKIMQSALSGKPVIALCGKVWVPGRDPSKFPVCPACKAIFDGRFGPGNGDDGGGSGGPAGGGSGSGR